MGCELISLMLILPALQDLADRAAVEVAVLEAAEALAVVAEEQDEPPPPIPFI